LESSVQHGGADLQHMIQVEASLSLSHIEYSDAASSVRVHPSGIGLKFNVSSKQSAQFYNLVHIAYI
jgi:hypothetical protein